MGSIRYRKDRGAWFIDYVAADDRRIREVIGAGADGKRLAKKVLAQREAEAQLGIHRLPAAQTMRFADFALDWQERCRARLRPKTRELYDDLLTHHLLPALGQVRLGAITRQVVETYLATKAQARRRIKARNATGRPLRDAAGQPVWIDVPFAPKTINHTLVLLKSILADAVEHGHLTDSPAARVKPLAVPEAETLHVLRPEEITRLLDVAEEPWRTFYLLAVHSGARRGELLAVRWRDLDLAVGQLMIRRSLNRVREGAAWVLAESPPKTRASKRTIDLSPAVVQALLAMPAGDDPERDFVFRSRAGGPIDPDNVDRAWKRHLAAAGLADRPFHSTRHTHASLLIAAGVHPKAMHARLGHATIGTTLNVYGHLMPSAFEGIGTRIDALIGRLVEREANASSV